MPDAPSLEKAERGSLVRITIQLGHILPVAAFGQLATAISDYYAIATALMSVHDPVPHRALLRERWGERKEAPPMTFFDVFRHHGVTNRNLQLFLESDARWMLDPRVVRASYGSPRSVTVEGGAALATLVEVLHRGDLQREEMIAIIERIKTETDVHQAEAERLRAEADLLRAQARDRGVATLERAIVVMRSLGYTDDQIRESLSGKLSAAVVSEPVARLQDLEHALVIEGVERE